MSSINALRIRKGSPVSLKNGIAKKLDMMGIHQVQWLKGGVFLPNTPGMQLQCLSQLSSGSVFLKHTVRGWLDNGCSSRGFGWQWVETSIWCSQKNELNDASEPSKDALASVEPLVFEGSSLKNERKSKSSVKSHEAKQGVDGSANELDEAEFHSALNLCNGRLGHEVSIYAFLLRIGLHNLNGCLWILLTQRTKSWQQIEMNIEGLIANDISDHCHLCSEDPSSLLRKARRNKV
ncbi:hypothetical protein TIFTF001_041840 [Ficus carica]|uniref:Uncharacterized protein n=1 Tax=Ficus carica TaxID=3494 RepID=A0AA88CWG4_FICCA|nr:hypothetical protein TIFTF001_041840 [Ficus carica]